MGYCRFFHLTCISYMISQTLADAIYAKVYLALVERDNELLHSIIKNSEIYDNAATYYSSNSTLKWKDLLCYVKYDNVLMIELLHGTYTIGMTLSETILETIEEFKEVLIFE